MLCEQRAGGHRKVLLEIRLGRHFRCDEPGTDSLPNRGVAGDSDRLEYDELPLRWGNLHGRGSGARGGKRAERDIDTEQEEVSFAVEVRVEVGLRNLGASRDARRGGAVIAVQAELVESGL